MRAVNRRALRSLHDAEIALLVAAQRAARRNAVRAIDAALSARHGAAIALVVARFADRRAAIRAKDEPERAAALRQIAAEEVQELARLALELAAEKRALRLSALLSMVTAHRAERRILRRRNRRQRIAAAILYQVAEPPLRSRSRQSGGQRIARQRTAGIVKILPMKA